MGLESRGERDVDLTCTADPGVDRTGAYLRTQGTFAGVSTSSVQMQHGPPSL